MAALGKGAIFLILFFLWCAYVVLGIFVFAATEGNVVHNFQERRERQNMTGLKAETMEKHNMTEAEFETLAKKIREVANSHKDYHDERRWNYIDSFWFVVVLLTTIGKEKKIDVINAKIMSQPGASESSRLRNNKGTKASAGFVFI